MMRYRIFFICIFSIIVINSVIVSGTADEPSVWFKLVIDVLKSEKQLDPNSFTNYHDKITRKDFAYLGVRLYEIHTGLTAKIGDSTFSDTNDEWVLKAKNIGIVSGYSGGVFKPNQYIRRDELTHLFMTVLAKSNAIYLPKGSVTFSDDATIQAWAKNAVYTAYANGIIGGVGNNTFNPSGNATREQALAIFYNGLYGKTIKTKRALQFENPVMENSFFALQKAWPDVIEAYEKGHLQKIMTESTNGTVLLTFGRDENAYYFSWNIFGKDTPIEMPTGDYWTVHSAILKGSERNVVKNLVAAPHIKCGTHGIIITAGASASPVIKGVQVVGDAKVKPWVFEKSDGDLWFSTWADNDALYYSWGDGMGIIDSHKSITDMGIATITGFGSALVGKNIFKDNLPGDIKPIDDKPSSLLYLNHQLIGHFHSPLGDPDVGYIAWSNDFGTTWNRVLKSPWTKENNSVFRCMFFINQGKNYALNNDGYVYALAIGKEWGWSGEVYLARVLADKITDYSAYTYYQQLGSEILWHKEQLRATPMSGLHADQQFSAIYHPGVKRYIAMTQQYVYDAPAPWGPWTVAGEWIKPGWLGYQPGIISKGMESDSFWFTISGQPQYGDEVPYKLCMGKIQLILK